MTKVVGRKILIFFLTLIGFLLISNEVFAATTIETPTNVPAEVQLSQTFSFNTNITGTQAGEVYFVKCRLGQTSTTLTEGQTYNPTTDTWLSDTGSTGLWIDMPTVNTSGNSVGVSIQCRVKSNVPSGQKVIYARACLKKSDGSCGSGASFQSSSGTPTNAISSSSPTSPIPTPSPTPTSNPTPTSSTSQSSSSFIISGIPSQINSDQSFTVSVNLSLPNNPSTTFYLKGAFKTSDGSNYFGQTKVSGSWIKNGSSYSSQLAITTDSSGNWSGNLEVKPDAEDSGLTGSGDYIFKVGRYTSSGSGPTWSNEGTIKIVGAAKGSDSSDTNTLSTFPSPTSSTIQTASSKPKNSSKSEYKIASIAGVIATATPSASPSTEVKSQKQTNFPLIIGVLLIVSGLGMSSYIYLRSHETIFNQFRKRN